MKINSIINRYLLKEMVPPFIINLVFFTFVFLMAKILDIMNLIVNYNIGVKKIAVMIACMLPFFLEFVIPLAVMITVLLIFMRIASDNEVIALEAGGMSLFGFLPPAVLFCCIGCIFTGIVTIYGVPWGKTYTKNLLYELATQNMDIGLKERTFNDSFKEVTLYISKIDSKDKVLYDVFIEDQRTENIVSVITAPRGILFKEKDRLATHMRLFNGKINHAGLKNRSANSIDFDTYDIRLDLENVDTDIRKTKHKKEMSLSEMRNYLKTAPSKNGTFYSILIEYHKKFSIPFACLFLGFLAIPLGIMSSSVKRSFGIGLGLIFFLIYYILLSIGKVFGETGVYPPFIGMWIPNLVIGCIGIYLFLRTARNRPLKIDILQQILISLNYRFFGRSKR